MTTHPFVMTAAAGLLAAGVSARAAEDGAPMTTNEPPPGIARVIEDGGASLSYRFFAPEKIEPGRRYPLVLFLHGAGERGGDNVAQIKHGVRDLVRLAAEAGDPVFLIAPQCPAEKKWVEVDWSAKTHTMPAEPAAALRLARQAVDQAVRENPIDPARLYLTGLSMGGYGTWDGLQRWPGFFAAGIPICGGGDPNGAAVLAKTPVWVFHGDQDAAVPVVRSRNMVEALTAAGGHPKYTEYPGVGHDAWTATYRNPEVIRWLLAQRKKAAP
jgi:predicted peptidase